MALFPWLAIHCPGFGGPACAASGSRALDMGNVLAAVAAPGAGHRPGLGDDLHVLPPEGMSVSMKTITRLGELTLVILSFYLFLALDYAWWWFPVLFFAPE